MKHFSIGLAVLFLALSVPSVVSAQHKIGYINMDELIAAMPDTRQAQQILKRAGDSLGRIDGGIQQEFLMARNDFFRDSASLDTASKEAHRRVLQKFITQEQEFRADAKAQLDSMQQVLTEAITTKAQEAIVTVAKANGYAYVFPRVARTGDQQRDFVIIGPERDDLLPLVKKQLGLEVQ